MMKQVVVGMSETEKTEGESENLQTVNDFK